MEHNKTIVNDPDTSSPRREDRKLELMDWQKQDGERKAQELGIQMTPTHWQVVYFIREYYLENGLPESARVLSDALEEAFRAEGGRRYLYTLFPDGPVKQASLIAGLKIPPRFAEDRSFGTVM